MRGFIIRFFALFIAFLLGLNIGETNGKKEVVESCETQGVFITLDHNRLLCVVKPNIEINKGNLNYLRPTSSKVRKV